jgi:DNA-binding PadR family transcriptional regulator
MDTKTLCLGVLSLQDATGYEIKKVFEDAYSHFQGASYGSIYPALTELTRAGLATYQVEQDANRPQKKRYRITEAGRRRLVATLMDAKPSERFRSDLLVVLFYAHLLPRVRVAAILDAHIDSLRNDLHALEQAAGCAGLTAGMRLSIGYGLASKRARLAYLEQHRQGLLDTLPTAGESHAR